MTRSPRMSKIVCAIRSTGTGLASAPAVFLGAMAEPPLVVTDHPAL
jgi:hypothetical protein